MQTTLKARKSTKPVVCALLRQLRQVAANDPKQKQKIFEEADKLLNGWMGTKDKPGWASKMIDAHKERLYLCEMNDDIGGGFNKAQALVKVLTDRLKANQGDLNTRNHYLDCYWYMVYFLNEDGKRSTEASKAQKRTELASSYLGTLADDYPDFGSDVMRKKFVDLLNVEPALKAGYLEACFKSANNLYLEAKKYENAKDDNVNLGISQPGQGGEPPCRAGGAVPGLREPRHEAEVQ